MIKVLLEAPIYTQSGYGEHARFVYRSLVENKNLDIHINPLNWGRTPWSADISFKEKSMIDNSIKKLGKVIEGNNNGNVTNFDLQIHVGIPNEFQKKAAYSICVTAGIETDRVSDSWLAKTYQGLDKLIVPSQHSKDGFINTAYEIINKENDTKSILQCNSDVVVVPYPVKSVEIEHLDFELDTKFNFLLVGLLGPRKNIEQTIKCFLKEFENDEVGLVIKTSKTGGSIIDRDYTEKIIKSLVGNKNRKCKVYLLHGNLSDSEIHSLYKREDIHCYVSATAGEGFGLPIFEAAYSDLPVIATDWSAHVEYLSAPYKEGGKFKEKKLFAKVDYDIKSIPESVVWKDILIEGSQWAYPKETSLKKQMRNVYKNYGMYRKWANVLGENIRNKYEKSIITEKMREALLSDIGLYNGEEEFDLALAKQEALNIENVKERSKFIKHVLSKDLSQIEKVQFLKDIFKNKKSYLLSCGPTLTDHDQQKVRELLEDNLVVSIKQSFELYKDLVDFHVYNGGNFKEYDYSEYNPIVLEASVMVQRLGDCDLKFFIRERNFQNSISVKKNFDDWTFDKQPLLRPFGPGIMYEIVFFTLQHLGVSDIITIGWDNKLIEGDASQQHFYDKIGSGFSKDDFIDHNEVAANPAAVKTLEEEANIASEVIKDWHTWLDSQGIKLSIISSLNPAPDSVERITI